MSSQRRITRQKTTLANSEVNTRSMFPLTENKFVWSSRKHCVFCRDVNRHCGAHSVQVGWVWARWVGECVQIFCRYELQWFFEKIIIRARDGMCFVQSFSLWENGDWVYFPFSFGEYHQRSVIFWKQQIMFTHHNERLTRKSTTLVRSEYDKAALNILFTEK